MIRHGRTVISGKEVSFNTETGQVVARGQVRLEQNGQIWSGEQLTYNLKTNQTPLEQYVAEVQIRLVGPQLVKEADIRTNIHVQVGVPFDRVAVDQDVRDLYATGLFYNVRVSNEKTKEGTKLIYIAQCNPRLVGLEFKGNTKFSDADLQKSITSRVGGLLNEKRLFLDSQQIQEKYEKAGYQGTSVRYVTENDEAEGEAKATFRITETR
jgi:outer membrane protein insertion porin family